MNNSAMDTKQLLNLIDEENEENKLKNKSIQTQTTGFEHESDNEDKQIDTLEWSDEDKRGSKTLSEIASDLSLENELDLMNIGKQLKHFRSVGKVSQNFDGLYKKVRLYHRDDINAIKKILSDQFHNQ